MKIRFSVVLALSFLLSCSSNNDNDNGTNPPDPTAADILGSVNLYDEGTTQIDNSNMTVRVEGTSKSATTDAEGDFVLSDVTFGTLTLVYEKTGYGTFKRFNLQHANGNTIISENASLGEKSTTSITNLEASVEDGTISIATTIDPDASIGNTRYLRYFFSTESNVSNEDYQAVLDALQAQINPYNLNLTTASLEALGFQSGQTVYVKCYGESFWSNQYDDPDLGTTVFPNLNMNAADAVSFVVP